MSLLFFVTLAILCVIIFLVAATATPEILVGLVAIGAILIATYGLTTVVFHSEASPEAYTQASQMTDPADIQLLSQAMTDGKLTSGEWHDIETQSARRAALATAGTATTTPAPAPVPSTVQPAAQPAPAPTPEPTSAAPSAARTPAAMSATNTALPSPAQMLSITLAERAASRRITAAQEQ